MITWFRSLSFSWKLAMLSGIPALLALGLGLAAMAYLQAEVRASERLRVEVDLALSLGNLSHQYALERGLSAGFVGSKGAQGGPQLLERRRVTDEATRSFTIDWQQVAAYESESLRQQGQQLFALIDQKAQIRQTVDALTQPSPAFAYYSELNLAVLDVMESLSLHETDPEVATQSFYYRNLRWATEKAGQLRGKLNGVIAKGELQPFALAEIRDYIRSQNQFLVKALRNAPPDVLAAIKAFQRSEDYLAVQAVSDILLQDGASLELLVPSHRENWFVLATRYIDALKQSADAMAKAVQAKLVDNQAKLERQLLWGSVTLALLFILLTMFAVGQARDLSVRVAVVGNVLDRISTDGDLTLRIDDGAGDEIGCIAQNIDRFLTKFQDLVRSIQLASGLLQSNSQELSGVIESNRNAIDAQREQTQSVASAITEMAASFSEVARSTVSAEESSRAAQDSSMQGQRSVDQTCQAVSHLAEEIDRAEATIVEVANHCQQIGGILDTIRGIAEQTNLLALNAAIEAARAGEQGRGFAVVADEVRSLAQRTQTSTEEINRMITTLQRSASEAQNTMRSSRDTANNCRNFAVNSGDAMTNVHTNIGSLHEMTCQIAAATEQQSAVAETLTENVVNISQMAEGIMQTSRTLEQGGHDLSQMAALLGATVQRYRVS